MRKAKNEANLREVKSARRQPTRRRKAPLPEGVWSIVPVDGTATRRKARREYDKVLRDLDEAKAEAERFESEDKPKFARWLSANFGATLTEIRELQEKLFQAQTLVDEVQEEFYWGNYRSVANAYKKVMHQRNHPEELEAQAEEERLEEEEFRREFEEAMGDIENEFRKQIGGGGEGPRQRSQQNTRAHPAPHNRLKDLYRNLVRRLHPDKGAKRTAKEIEWWHQTQAAYQVGNVEQLELILTLIEVEEKGSKEASVSVLTQLTGEFKKSLRSLKRKIADFRKDAAWNFSRLADFSGIFERTRRQLETDRDKILWLLKRCEEQIRGWETTAAAPRKKARRRTASYQDEEWF